MAKNLESFYDYLGSLLTVFLIYTSLRWLSLLLLLLLIFVEITLWISAWINWAAA